MKNIKIILEYDGTEYSGWQIQANTGSTIQQILEDNLSQLNKRKIKVTGAGRTDAGVHALHQVANFPLHVDIPVANIPEALNSMLPSDIICKWAEEVDGSFHAQYDAQSKLYRYRIINRSYSSVFRRFFVYNVRQPLDFARMKNATPFFSGRHDFSAFMASGSEVEDTVRTIKDIKVYRANDEIRIDVCGDGFLYKMVRIITGTLLEIGLNKKSPADVSRIIAGCDRQRAGFTAPACGLTLMKVNY